MDVRKWKRGLRLPMAGAPSGIIPLNSARVSLSLARKVYERRRYYEG